MYGDRTSAYVIRNKISFQECYKRKEHDESPLMVVENPGRTILTPLRGATGPQPFLGYEPPRPIVTALRAALISRVTCPL